MAFAGTFPDSATYPGSTLYPGDALPDPPVFAAGDGAGGNVDEATIRIQPLGGRWETLGVDRLAGIVAEGIEASANEWGPDVLSFALKAEADARRPDILPFTPIQLEVGGDLVWSGFVWSRPTDANGYSVSCRGWQYHLDDGLYERVYVHSRISDYRDQRTFLGADLTRFRQNGTVSTSDAGAIVIGYPEIAVVQATDSVGITLDLGPDSTAMRVVMEWESSNNVAGISCFCRGTVGESSQPTAGYSDAFSFAMNSGASGTSAGTFAYGLRYIHVFLYDASTTYNPIAGDVFLRIKSIKVFAQTAYEAGNVSVLKADTVIKSALAMAPLLNQDTARIGAGSFSIPEYRTPGFVSPKTVMEGINAYENYRLKIGGPDLKTLVFDPKPTSPIAEVGEWSGAQFADATVTGEPIYNLAIIDATGPDGGRIRVFRGSGIAAGALQQITGFTLPLTNASPSSAGNVNTTSERDPSTASTFANFKAGVPYTIIINSATAGASGNTGGAATSWRVRLGDFGYGTGTSNPVRGSTPRYIELNFTIPAGGTVGPFYATYVPDRDHTWLEGEITQLAGSVTNGALTSFTHGSYRGTTMLDRRGVVRATVLPVNSAISEAVGERFADLWLAEHATAPFAGSLTLTGGDSARALPGGTDIRAHEFLLFGGENIRFSNRVDPDTGSWGRDGRIAGVTYRHDAREADIAISDRRDNFERILSRYGVLVDQFT